MTTPDTKLIKDDFSISSTIPTRRLSIRIDQDTYTALELAYGHAVRSRKYRFRDKTGFTRFLIHQAFRQIVEECTPPDNILPIRFGGRQDENG